MTLLTWIIEKGLERKIKNKGDQFRWKKYKKLISGDEKMINACSGHQGENKRERKETKGEQEHIHVQHFLHKTCKLTCCN